MCDHSPSIGRTRPRQPRLAGYVPRVLFRETGARQVSTEGGFAPVWRSDGKELFYITGLGNVMRLEAKAGSSLQTGPPKLLFQAQSSNHNMPQFAVLDNGRKFLVIETPARRVTDERMVVVTNWNASLR